MEPCPMRRGRPTGSPALLRVLLPTAALLTASVEARAQLRHYYVQEATDPRARNLKLVAADPTGVKPRYWSVRLYRRGAPQTGDSNWGLLVGSTAAGVMAQLERLKAAELHADRYFGRTGDRDTYFNALGPIAVFGLDFRRPAPGGCPTREPDCGTVDSPNLVVLNQAQADLAAMTGRLRQLQASAIRGAAGKRLFAAVGRTEREYARLLEDATRRVHRLRKTMAVQTAQSVAEIDREIGNLESQLESARKLDTAIGNALASAAAEQARAKTAPGPGTSSHPPTWVTSSGAVYRLLGSAGPIGYYWRPEEWPGANGAVVITTKLVPGVVRHTFSLELHCSGGRRLIRSEDTVSDFEDDVEQSGATNVLCDYPHRALDLKLTAARIAGARR